MILLSVTAAPCVKTQFIFTGTADCIEQSGSTSERNAEYLQFKFLNYDAFKTQFVLAKVEVCSDEEFF